MKTLKLKIKNSDEIRESLKPFLYQYTGLFHKLYKHESNTDKKELLKKFDLLDVSIYESCKMNVSMRINQQNTIKKNKLNSIVDIKKELIELNNQKDRLSSNIKHTKRFNKRTKLSKKIYKLNSKLSSLNNSINKDITYGGKSLLRTISYQNNLKNSNSEKFNPEVLQNSLNEYRSKRLLPFYVVGRASDGGNRKFDFKFSIESNTKNNMIIFKPNKRTKINIEYCANRNYENELNRLQKLVNSNSVSITVTLGLDYICLTYDESVFKNNTEVSLERYLAIDLNPKEIGYCIVQKDSSKNEFKTLYKELVSLKKLSVRLNRSSSSSVQKKQNNKRKFEIIQVWKRIFNIAKCFKVSCIIIEDLEFKSKDLGNEVNKQVNNLWHRELTLKQIQKRCNEGGIELRLVNPAYSSLIGNLSFEDYDCVASSLELARRGINKYVKGNRVYPEVGREHIDRVNHVFCGKSTSLKVKSWKEIYTLLSNSELRYRNKNHKWFLTESNMSSYKSCVFTTQYSCNNVITI